MSTVIFLDYFEDLRKAAPFIRRICDNLKCRPIIVSSNFEISPLTIYPDLKVIYFDEFLSKEDYEHIDSRAFDLTKTWYLWLKPIEGVTEYNGIRFGSLTQERAQRFFSSAIKILEITLKIIERFCPNKIILIGKGENFRNISLLIKNELNISTLFIEYKESNNSFTGIMKKLRRSILEIISNICDYLIRKSVIKKKINNGILIDYRIYNELKGLSKDFFLLQYIIENGMRLRLRLIKSERLLFVPLPTEDSIGLPNIFGSYARYWKSLKKDVHFQNKFIYRNLPIWKILEDIIRELIIHYFPRINNNITFLKKLYKSLPIKLVILREDVREVQKTMVFTAKQTKMPSLVIQHGLLTGGCVYTKLDSDKIALWGKAGIDWYGAYGNDVSNCVVTGKLQHDHHYLKKDDYKKKGEDILLKIGASTNKDVILLIAGYFKWAENNMLFTYDSPCAEYIALNSILNIVKYFPDKQLIVKIHPFDLISPASLSNFIKGCPNAFVVKNVDIIALIATSSLVITSLFSSAALDAVIFNKPLIILNLYKREDLIPFAKRGVALSVTKPEDLYQAVRQIFEDRKLRDWFASNRASFIYDYAYKIDGKSTERAMDLIKGLCNRSTTQTEIPRGINEYIISQSSV